MLFYGGPGLDHDAATTSADEQSMRTALTEQMDKLALSIGLCCLQVKLVALTDDRLSGRRGIVDVRLCAA